MTQLLALCFDCPTSPSLSLKKRDKPKEHDEQLHGWGFAWYPNEDYAAAIMKDTKTYSGNLLSSVLSDWKRFNSTIFISQLRGAAKRRSEQDTQPFSRSYAGRDWVMSHNGDLNENYKTALPLSEHSIFETMGLTDSEHIFCWLLEKLQAHNVRRIADLDPRALHHWLKEINKLGSFNLMLGDGEELLIYQDKDLFNEIHWARKTPPHQQVVFESVVTRLEIDPAQDAHRTFLVFSTSKDFIKSSHPMLPSQLIIARRGDVIWNSEAKINKPVESPSNAQEPSKTIEDIIYSKDKRLTIAKMPNRISDIDNEKFILNVSHETVYRYDKPIELSRHAFRLCPVHDDHQEVMDYNLSLSIGARYESFMDVFGNHVTIVEIDKPFSELILRMDAKVRLRNIPTTEFSRLKNPASIPLVWMPWQRQMMLPYLLPPELPEAQLTELTDFAMSFVKRNDSDVLHVLMDINRTIYNDFDYVSGSTTLETTPYDVYIHRRGVCQDFANLFICLARLLSIPARYRTGYIYTGANYENKVQSEASHAWLEVYLPWLGWRGFDPTNGCLTGTDHIRVACGRNYYDSTPTEGTIYKGGGKETLEVDVKVTLENEREAK